MADATIVATTVVKTANTVIQSGIAGATITAGQVLWIDAANGYVLKPASAVAGGGAPNAAVAVGIALNGGAVGQTITYASDGDVTMPTVIAGQVYVVSANAGGLAPTADLDLSTGTNYATIVGVGLSASVLRLGIIASGVLNA